MPDHENKNCPRCNATFECKVGNIMQCQCSQVMLSAEEQNYIGTLFHDCVCYDCLMQLKNEYARSGNNYLLQAKQHR